MESMNWPSIWVCIVLTSAGPCICYTTCFDPISRCWCKQDCCTTIARKCDFALGTRILGLELAERNSHFLKMFERDVGETSVLSAPNIWWQAEIYLENSCEMLKLLYFQITVHRSGPGARRGGWWGGDFGWDRSISLSGFNFFGNFGEICSLQNLQNLYPQIKIFRENICQQFNQYHRTSAVQTIDSIELFQLLWGKYLSTARAISYTRVQNYSIPIPIRILRLCRCDRDYGLAPSPWICLGSSNWGEKNGYWRWWIMFHILIFFVLIRIQKVKSTNYELYHE